MPVLRESEWTGLTCHVVVPATLTLIWLWQCCPWWLYAHCQSSACWLRHACFSSASLARNRESSRECHTLTCLVHLPSSWRMWILATPETRSRYPDVWLMDESSFGANVGHPFFFTNLNSLSLSGFFWIKFILLLVSHVADSSTQNVPINQKTS